MGCIFLPPLVNCNCTCWCSDDSKKTGRKAVLLLTSLESSVVLQINALLQAVKKKKKLSLSLLLCRLAQRKCKVKRKNVQDQRKMNNSELSKCLWFDSFSDTDREECSSPSRAEYTGDLPAENAAAPVSSGRSAHPSISLCL